jgi:glycine/D-amino acid oxidase-like deaminating enzyme
VERKIAGGELAPFADEGAVSEHGVAIAGAAWVDLPALLDASAARWQASGRWRDAPAGIAARDLTVTDDAVTWAGEQFDLAVLCTGSGPLAREWFDGVPFAAAQGEMLAVRGCSWPPDTAVSRGTWLIAGEGGAARVGATYERGREDFALTPAARAHLLAEATALSGDALEVTGQSVGVRLTLPDRLPVIGRHPRQARLGIFGGLGSKGALWAPWLARQWSAAATDAMKRFPPEVSVERWRNGRSAAGVRLSVEN